MITLIKQWIIKSFFQKELIKVLEEATRQGSLDAFKKAHEDIMSTRVDDIEERAEELSKEKLASLLSPVDLHKIITMDKRNGLIYIGGEKVEDNRLHNLKSEAEFFLESELWQLIQETPKELAQKVMFVAGKSLADMAKGRSILYTLSAQKNILEILKSYTK